MSKEQALKEYETIVEMARKARKEATAAQIKAIELEIQAQVKRKILMETLVSKQK